MFDEAFFHKTLTPLWAIIGTILGLIGTLLGILTYRLHRQRQRLDLIVEVGRQMELSND